MSPVVEKAARAGYLVVGVVGPGCKEACRRACSVLYFQLSMCLAPSMNGSHHQLVGVKRAGGEQRGGTEGEIE